MKHVLLLLLCLSISGSVWAQKSNQDKPVSADGQVKKKPSAAQMASKQAANMQKLLTLTDEQKIKIEKAALTRITQMNALREEHKGEKITGPVAKGKMRTIRQEYVSTVNSVLSPDQQIEWKKIRDARKEKMKAKRAAEKGSSTAPKSAAESDLENDPNEDVDE